MHLSRISDQLGAQIRGRLEGLKINAALTGDTVFQAAQARIFGKVDGDGDGALSAAELGALAQSGAIDPAYFAAFDKDADGKLRLDELQPSKLFSMNTLDALLGAQAEAAGEVGHRFEASNIAAWMVGEGDQDGDGMLSAEEFAAVGPEGEWKPLSGATPDPALGQDILSKAGRAFFQADKDKDGVLTSEELAALMEGGLHRVYIGQDVSGMAPNLMDRADSDGDRALSLAEARATGTNPAGLDTLFQEADADADGKLSADEIAAQVDRRAAYYRSGLARLGPDMPSEGENALYRMLRASLDQLGAQIAADLRSPLFDRSA